MVFLIKADNPKIGYVAIIYIGTLLSDLGMTEISSCVASRKIGEKVKKGEHIGHFAYGGSSHAMIFQKSAQLSFSERLYEL
jgi:phosphatidylserine decarboxylase